MVGQEGLWRGAAFAVLGEVGSALEAGLFGEDAVYIYVRARRIGSRAAEKSRRPPKSETHVGGWLSRMAGGPGDTLALSEHMQGYVVSKCLCPVGSYDY